MFSFIDQGLFELLFFIVFVALLFFSLSENIRLRILNKKLSQELDKGIIDLMAIAKKYEDAVKSNDGKNIENSEGFLRFVSESRDWAFQYIERVQIAIKNFQDIFHPMAKSYYVDKDKPIDQEEFGKLFEAYKKLIEELPDEGKSK
jgi:hypothetical protein